VANADNLIDGCWRDGPRARVEPALLSDDEVAWFASCHGRVYETLSPRLEGPAAQWLHEATRPVLYD